MRVLVADDDRVAATMVTQALVRCGLEVVVVHDGDEAWSVMRENTPLAMAVLDWMMPGLDGPELCRRIRQDPALAQMYVILLTGRQSRTDLVVGLGAGANDYIVKPFHGEELRARVQVGLRVITLQEHLSDRVVELEAALSKVKQLTGLLPICSYCKRIRSDQDYWEQVDSYVAHHSDAQFTHGICPHCYEAVRAQFLEPSPQISLDLASKKG